MEINAEIVLLFLLKFLGWYLYICLKMTSYIHISAISSAIFLLLLFEYKVSCHHFGDYSNNRIGKCLNGSLTCLWRAF